MNRNGSGGNGNGLSLTKSVCVAIDFRLAKRSSMVEAANLVAATPRPV